MRIFLHWLAIGVSALLMYFLFLDPPINIDIDKFNVEKNQYCVTGKATSHQSSSTADGNEKYLLQKKLMEMELDKSIKEIELRLNGESRWYELKFLFIGAIILSHLSSAS